MKERKARKRHDYSGSSFDSFLDEHGIREEAEAVATKRVLAWELEQAMRKQQKTKQAMARELHTSRSQLDRLLDPRNTAVSLDTITRAAKVLGKRVILRIANPHWDQPELPVGSISESTKENTLWTGNRRELLEWLRRNASSLAELFEGAVSLLYGSPVPGFSRFVSHAVREVRNRMPGVISGTSSSGRLDYKGRMDQIAAAWKTAGISLEGTGVRTENPDSAAASVSPQTALPRKLAQKIARLVADHEAAREKPMDAAIKLFEGVAPENEKFRDTLRPVVLQWLETCDWFMKRTHDSGAMDADVEVEELRKNFAIFETTLLTIVRGLSTFFANTDELDECLRGTPTPRTCGSDGGSTRTRRIPSLFLRST